MKYFLYAFLFAAIAFSLFTVIRILLTFELFDFVNGYYPALQDGLLGKGFYDNPILDILYPPTTFLFLIPFGFIDPNLGQKIWTILSLLSLVASIIMLLLSLHKLTLLNFLTIYSLATLAFPVKFTLGMGQINHFVLFFLSVAFFCYSKSKNTITGIFLGLAVSIKIIPIVLCLYFLRKKQWSTLFTTVLTIVVTVFLSGQLFGWQLYWQFINEVIPSIPTIGNDIYFNQSLTGFLARFKLDNAPAGILNFTVFSILLLASFILTTTNAVKTSDKPHLLPKHLIQYSLFLTTTLIGGGHALQHHFVFLLIPFVALFTLWDRLNKRNKLLILSSYVLISSNIKIPQTVPSTFLLLLSHVFLGTVLIYIVSIQSLLNGNSIPKRQ